MGISPEPRRMKVISAWLHDSPCAMCQGHARRPLGSSVWGLARLARLALSIWSSCVAWCFAVCVWGLSSIAIWSWWFLLRLAVLPSSSQFFPQKFCEVVRSLLHPAGTKLRETSPHNASCHGASLGFGCRFAVWFSDRKAFWILLTIWKLWDSWRCWRLFQSHCCGICCDSSDSATLWLLWCSRGPAQASATGAATWDVATQWRIKLGVGDLAALYGHIQPSWACVSWCFTHNCTRLHY